MPSTGTDGYLLNATQAYCPYTLSATGSLAQHEMYGWSNISTRAAPTILAEGSCNFGMHGDGHAAASCP